MDGARALRQLKALEKFEVRTGMRLAAEEWDAEWKTLIATIMSAQSRDETTIPIAEKLFVRYHSIDKLACAKYADVLAVFSGLNYNKTKAKNVVGCAKVIVDKYAGKVPHDLDKLVELPGVGRKTANVFLSEYGHDAMGVDTHLSYISRKLEWTRNNNPHKIEGDLSKLFPKKYWRRVNPIAVRFGKTHTSRKKKGEILREIRNIK